MERLTMAVPCLFGLEGLVGDELRRMGMEQVRVEDRRVFFEGDFLSMALANLRLRMGERVMILLARFPVRSFEELYQGVKAIALERFIPSDGAFPVKGYSLDSQLHSVPDCQSIVKKAAVDRLGAHYKMTWMPETAETYQLRFSILKDVCEVFLDTSGASLHKRGYRAVGNEAPLHETMAAALVHLSRYRGRDFFWDPFCGSGTIVIEAALTALNRAPGLNRTFAAQSWACVPPEVWTQARQEAKDGEYRGEYRILGTDIDPASLSIAIAAAMALAMLRVLTGLSILYFLIPGYAAALLLSFFVPDIYTAIAFDSGGVASGPMTATFMLQFMIGASMTLGGNVLTDAFGVVAMVAMMPLISIQAVGFYYTLKHRRAEKSAAVYGDYDIVELWEVEAA